MAGTIAADTLTHSSAGSVSTQYPVKGSAKMWISYSTASASPVVKGSFGTGSLTDTALGRTTIAFTTNMSNINYAGFAHTNATTATDSTGNLAEHSVTLLDRTTSDAELAVWKNSHVNAMGDASLNDMGVFGDLA